MATKITRKTHKVFGNSGSSDNFAQVGSLVAGDPVLTKDIAAIQGLAAWDEGLQSSVYGANKDLLLEDLNGIIFEHSTQVAYLFQAGVAEWDAGTSYFKGSIVQRTDVSGNATGELYLSMIDNNLNNPVPVQGNTAQWTWMNPPGIPPGSSVEFMGRVVQPGFLLEDGSAVSRTTYATLLGQIAYTLAGNLTNGSNVVTGIPSTANLRVGDWISGTGVPTGAKIQSVDSANQVTMTLNATSTQTPSTLLFAPWGVGDGATTFNVPDTRRRVGVGAGGAGTATLGADVGAYGGEETHTLTIAEMPTHHHVQTFLIYNFGVGGGGSGNPGSQTTQNTQDTGGGQAHNIIQPSYVCTKMIKY